MPWKTENGQLVIGEDGNPIAIYPDGSEKPFVFDSEYAKVADLNRKLLKRKKRLNVFEATMQMLNDAGIDTSSTEAIQKFLGDASENASLVENFNDSDMLKTEDVKKLEEKIAEKFTAKLEKQKAGYEQKLRAAEEEISGQKDMIHNSVIKNAFLSSEFIRKKTSFPHPEVAYDYLRSFFSVKKLPDGSVTGVGLDSDGDPLLSVANPSAEAGIEEAIELVIRSHPQKDALLVPDGTGTGGKGSKTIKTDNGAPKTIPRHDNQAFLDNLEGLAKGETVTAE